MNEDALISRHMLDTGEKIVVTEVWDVGHPACPFNVMAAYESQLYPGQRQYEVDRAEFCAKPLRAKGGLELVTPATLKRDAPENKTMMEGARGLRLIPAVHDPVLLEADRTLRTKR